MSSSSELSSSGSLSSFEEKAQRFVARRRSQLTTPTKNQQMTRKTTPIAQNVKKSRRKTDDAISSKVKPPSPNLKHAILKVIADEVIELQKDAMEEKKSTRGIIQKVLRQQITDFPWLTHGMLTYFIKRNYPPQMIETTISVVDNKSELTMDHVLLFCCPQSPSPVANDADEFVESVQSYSCCDTEEVGSATSSSYARGLQWYIDRGLLTVE